MVAETLLATKEKFFSEEERIVHRVDGLLTFMRERLADNPTIYDEAVETMKALAARNGIHFDPSALPPRRETAALPEGHLGGHFRRNVALDGVHDVFAATCWLDALWRSTIMNEGDR
ncbi:hypothetical protein D3C78_1637240 [compost metagenome]